LMDPIGAVGCAASARAELGGVAGGPGSAAGGAAGASTVGGDAGGGDAGCAGGWGGRDDTVGGALGVAVSVGDEAAAAVGGDTGSDDGAAISVDASPPLANSAITVAMAITSPPATPPRITIRRAGACVEARWRMPAARESVVSSRDGFSVVGCGGTVVGTAECGGTVVGTAEYGGSVVGTAEYGGSVVGASRREGAGFAASRRGRRADERSGRVVATPMSCGSVGSTAASVAASISGGSVGATPVELPRSPFRSRSSSEVTGARTGCDPDPAS